MVEIQADASLKIKKNYNVTTILTPTMFFFTQKTFLKFLHKYLNKIKSSLSTWK
jgi:hypothetical protein